MKKANILLAIILFSAFAAYPFLKKEFNSENINITVSENEKELTISAKYPLDKTKNIQKILGKQFGQAVFTNLEMDGVITLDDKTSFYLKNTKGKLKIEFDKRKNNKKSYQNMKHFGEDLKGILTDK